VQEAISKIPDEPVSKANSIIHNPEQDYSSMTLTQLKAIAKKQKIKGYSNMKKEALIAALTKFEKKLSKL
jgi:hypothetical protein